MRRAAVAAAVRHENVAAAVAAPPVPMPPVAPPPGVVEAAQAAVQVAATVSQQVPLFQHAAQHECPCHCRREHALRAPSLHACVLEMHTLPEEVAKAPPW